MDMRILAVRRPYGELVINGCCGKGADRSPQFVTITVFRQVRLGGRRHPVLQKRI